MANEETHTPEAWANAIARRIRDEGPWGDANVVIADLIETAILEDQRLLDLLVGSDLIEKNYWEEIEENYWEELT